jgi:aminomethyltransferase
MKQTVLHQKQIQAKAKMTEFQGWLVPFQYGNILDEYHAVRAAAGLFDISYLGRIEIAGRDAASLLQNIFTRNLDNMKEGSAHYGFICNESGYILDDAVLFHHPVGTDVKRYLLTTNALNTDKILNLLKQHSTGETSITDATETLAHLSLQGPQSSAILENVMGKHLKKIKLRSMRAIAFLDTPVLAVRTGFTGELGYELLFPADSAGAIWDAILAMGSSSGLLPCGLASRDVLRMEMGYLQYGEDLDEARTPLETGLESFVDFNKDFIGRESLLKLKTEGTKQKLAGFVLLDTGVPKKGASIFSENREIGQVTSGCQSPSARSGIGLGYVVSRYAQPGQEIEIEVKDREVAAKIVDLPFYKKK